MRVLSMNGVSRAFGSGAKGRSRTAYATEEIGARPLPPFLSSESIKSLISDDLKAPLGSPIEYKPRRGGRTAFGYEAYLLPKICGLILDAHKVKPIQNPEIPQMAEMLLRGFAEIGIVALVDEATGYQEVREKDALQALLDLYLRKELAAWAKRFPDEFYQQIFRLRGWIWRGRSTNPPQVVATYTKDIVYARLQEGLLEELEKKNPVDEKGKRKNKHFQWLTDDVGHPALAQHLHAVIGLMRASATWDQFKNMLDMAFPKRGDTLMMPILLEPPPEK